MKDYFKITGLAVLAVITFGILAFIANSIGLVSLSIFAPKVEQVRYDTFKQSQSYNEGMLRDLQNLQLEYIKATPDQKTALKAIILQRFSAYDVDKLPPDLMTFYMSIKNPINFPTN